MNYQAGVRVLDGAQNLKKQNDAAPYRECVFIAVGCQVDYLDVLDREKRAPALCDAGIVKPRDPRVYQARENVLLAIQPLGEHRAACACVGKFQRPWTFQETICSLGKPDFAHTSAAMSFSMR